MLKKLVLCGLLSVAFNALAECDVKFDRKNYPSGIIFNRIPSDTILEGRIVLLNVDSENNGSITGFLLQDSNGKTTSISTGILDRSTCFTSNQFIPLILKNNNEVRVYLSANCLIEEAGTERCSYKANNIRVLKYANRG